MADFKLGSRLRDKVSGFTGIATSKVEYINGCVQYCIVPKTDEAGKYVDGIYFDHQRLEVVDEGINVSSSNTGGPIHRGETPPTR